MGRAIDLFVTYRFLRLLTTPFEDTDAFKFGIIDEKGNRIKKKGSTKPEVELATSELKNSYTILHKLVFNIKKIFNKVPGLRTKVGTYAAALFLLKDTFKESVNDPDMFEKEFIKFLKENDINYLSHTNIATGKDSFCKSIVWIPDFQYLHLPKLFSFKY